VKAGVYGSRIGSGSFLAMIQIHCRGWATVTASETSGSPGNGSRWARLNRRLGWKGWAGVGAQGNGNTVCSGNTANNYGTGLSNNP
jgi:hypothetical protein